MTRTIKHSFYITLLIALALIVGSCEEGPAGIFSSVSQETATNLTMTDALEYTSPSFVARLGTTWYAGIGTLWSKAESATTWTSLSVTGINGVSADSYPFASSGATIGSTLYVAFSDSATGNDLGVWQTTDGSTWSKTPGLPTDRYLRTLLSANGELFAVSANVRSSAEDAANYQVHRLVTGSFGADIAGGTLTTLPTSVAYDGTNYWFTAGTAIYTGSAASITALGTIPTATGAPNGDYAGVCAMGSAVVVSSRYGYLFYS
ncbi:MAG: hypothetical protein JXM71_02970, partial [Spirochaetales bacterium]|nr:hypothetical protein [Spirochaetales bacterium]